MGVEPGPLKLEYGRAGSSREITEERTEGVVRYFIPPRDTWGSFGAGVLLYVLVAALAWGAFALSPIPIAVSIFFAYRIWRAFEIALSISRTVRIIQAGEDGLAITVPSPGGPAGANFPREGIRQIWVYSERFATSWVLLIRTVDGLYFLRFEPGRSPVVKSMQSSLRQALHLPDEPGRPGLRLARPIRGSE